MITVKSTESRSRPYQVQAFSVVSPLFDKKIVCRSCKLQSVAGTKFCPQCGEPLVVEAAAAGTSETLASE